MSGPGTRVLVVGSYPPVPTAGAAATLDLVRDLHTAGDYPVVVSPRASAAHFDVPVTGPLAGRRLRRVQDLARADRLVVVVEPDLPVPATAPHPALLAPLQRRSVASLVAEARSFEHVTLVLAERVEVDPSAWATLVAAADEVVDVRGRHQTTPGVTVLGPGAHDPRRLAVTTLGKVARRVLAPLPVPVRNAVYAGGRAALGRVAGRR